MDTKDIIIWLIQGLLFVVSGVFSFLFKAIYTDVENLKKELASVRVDLPTTYLSKSDFNRFEAKFDTEMEKFDRKLDGISNKLDNKMDK